jgi:hypothetical protein
MGKLRWFVAGAVVGLAAAAIGQELAKEPEERTWKGTVAGIPYNFRLEDWAAIAGEYWNPESDAVVAPHTIGLGWGINVAALVRRARALIEPQQPPEHSMPEVSRR